jgi:hypothetical protein
MITLATRTNVQIENGTLVHAYTDTVTNMPCRSDKEEYESDCVFLEMTIQKFYAAEMDRLMRKGPEVQQGATVNVNSTNENP